MAHNSSPYIDGNRGQVYRTVNGTGSSIDPHTNVVAPHDTFVYENGVYKALNVETRRYQQMAFEHTISVGGNSSPVLDCRNLETLNLKIVSIDAVLSDFIIAVTYDTSVDIWDDIANSDYHFTTGQGELMGNTMVLVRKCAPVNPRTLGANARTWINLNVSIYAHIYFKVFASVAGRLVYYTYGTLM